MTDSKKRLSVETLALHGGQEPDPTTGARAVPIYQTTSYQFRDTDHAAALFGLTEFGNIYTRLMNPTTDVFEKRMAAIDGGVGALAVASGQSAITLSLLNIARAGDEIVSADNLYGGTYNLFHYTFPRLGITVRFVKSNDLDALKKAINNKTKAVYAESIGNPKLDVADLEGIAKIAHDNGIPLVLDNTVSPYLLRPIDFGVDIVVYSATKFIGGHGTSIGGIIVDSGKFDWTNGKFPLISGAGPELPWHRLREGPQAARQHRLHHQGARLSCCGISDRLSRPSTRFSSCMGLETIHLRMPRHSENALAVAQHLSSHKKVAWVNYPGLPDQSGAGPC